MLGGNSILLGYQVMRHMVDLEAIHTFEGDAGLARHIIDCTMQSMMIICIHGRTHHPRRVR